MYHRSVHWESYDPMNPCHPNKNKFKKLKMYVISSSCIYKLFIECPWGVVLSLVDSVDKDMERPTMHSYHHIPHIITISIHLSNIKQLCVISIGSRACGQGYRDNLSTIFAFKEGDENIPT